MIDNDYFSFELHNAAIESVLLKIKEQTIPDDYNPLKDIPRLNIDGYLNGRLSKRVSPCTFKEVWKIIYHCALYGI